MINVLTAQNASLYASNRSLDGAQRASSDLQGSGQPESPEQASGVVANPDLQEATVDASTQAASTKIVEQPSEASEALGLTLGQNVDTFA
ncbi:hypothetical protein [Marinobacterium mangrovicola]|uniref:Uncharacterized protein n=1 Tax=Marinobacterium mangrovicola TaxID=1476959 RepID=A0A4R1GBM4_9GAMM|nr:hypothetical protein [Marinobacterium mangrovicola]TCK03069.1 hypothetical protein CLV83_4128 [Marinobacterium mangrovicola]